jgi:3-hydroxyacyl-CoA dehydrogenase
VTERFVVIGAGTMGAGIGYVAAGAGYSVELVEVDPARGEAALATLAQRWAGAVERGKLTTAEADLVLFEDDEKRARTTAFLDRRWPRPTGAAVTTGRSRRRRGAP